jgi:galactose mutarotase-like enzyme
VTHLIQLSDAAAQSVVSIAPARGAIVTSFRVAGRELLYMDEATLADPTKNVRGGIPVLFPTPGKLVQDQWHYGSKRGAMSQHGFARTLPWTVLEQHASKSKLQLESSAATSSQYPWAFRTEILFELRGTCLRLTTTIQNTSAEPMPYALGFHPYFAVADKSQARLPTMATQAFNNVSKTVEPFGGFDFTQQEVDLHLIDHAASHAALHLDASARIEVRASSDFVRWVVWTLAGRDFICLEPWTAPGNALNTGEHLCVLASHCAHTSWVEIEYAQ